MKYERAYLLSNLSDCLDLLYYLGSFVEALELLVTFVLIVLTLKAYFLDSMAGEVRSGPWYETPIALLLLLILFALMTLTIYIWQRSR